MRNQRFYLGKKQARELEKMNYYIHNFSGSPKVRQEKKWQLLPIIKEIRIGIKEIGKQ